MTLRLVSSRDDASEAGAAPPKGDAYAPIYRAQLCGGLWGILGPKGFIGCTGWTYAEVASRVRMMNLTCAGIRRVE